MNVNHQGKVVGATLVELIVALGIILVVAGIALPALAQGRRRAKASTSLSNMHQLGLAGALYNEEFGDWPSVYSLLRQGLPAEVAVSPLDQTELGIDREVRSLLWSKQTTMKVEPTRRVTYITPRTYHMMFRHWAAIHKAQGAGWLVDLSVGESTHPFYTLWSGPYRRLLFDTSVVTRHHSRLPKEGESGEPFIAQFADFSEEAMQGIKIGVY